MIYSRERGKKSIWKLDTIYERTKDEKGSSTQITNWQRVRRTSCQLVPLRGRMLDIKGVNSTQVETIEMLSY